MNTAWESLPSECSAAKIVLRSTVVLGDLSMGFESGRSLWKDPEI
jgi:hypothetical protein